MNCTSKYHTRTQLLHKVRPYDLVSLEEQLILMSLNNSLPPAMTTTTWYNNLIIQNTIALCDTSIIISQSRDIVSLLHCFYILIIIIINNVKDGNTLTLVGNIEDNSSSYSSIVTINTIGFRILTSSFLFTTLQCIQCMLGVAGNSCQMEMS